MFWFLLVLWFVVGFCSYMYLVVYIDSNDVKVSDIVILLLFTIFGLISFLMVFLINLCIYVGDEHRDKIIIKKETIKNLFKKDKIWTKLP